MVLTSRIVLPEVILTQRVALPDPRCRYRYCRPSFSHPLPPSRERKRAAGRTRGRESRRVGGLEAESESSQSDGGSSKILFSCLVAMRNPVVMTSVFDMRYPVLISCLLVSGGGGSGGAGLRGAARGSPDPSLHKAFYALAAHCPILPLLRAMRSLRLYVLCAHYAMSSAAAAMYYALAISGTDVRDHHAAYQGRRKLERWEEAAERDSHEQHRLFLSL